MENNIRRNINPAKIAKASWKYGSFVYVFLFMFIIYAIMNKNLNWAGTMTILTHTAVVGTIALGMGLIIISGDIDLSVGSTFAFAGGLGILTYNQIAKTTQNVAAAFIVTLLVIVAISAAIGFINGFMVGKMKMPAFIATLGTMLIFRSLCKFILKSIPMEGGQQQQTYQVFEYFDSPFYTLGNDKVLTIPIVGICLIVLTILVWYFAKHTKFGRKIYALGSNPKASSLAGINVPWTKIAIFTIAGALVGIAGFLHTGIYGSMDSSTAGMSYELYAIASCVIGGIAMTGGKGNIIGILFGAFSFQIIDKIISVANLNPLINDTIKGAILLVAVILQVVVIDKSAAVKWFQRIGIMFNPELDQVLEGELRKKVNNVKLDYDKKIKKVMANKKIDREQADALINELLDKREATIVKLNEIYALKVDNARLHAKEMARKLEIKARRSEMKNKIADLKFQHKKALKVAKVEKKFLTKDLNELVIAQANELKELVLAELAAIHELENNVDVLKDNAQHVLERDNNQDVFDKTTAKIDAYVIKVNAQYEANVAKANANYEAVASKANAAIEANQGNEQAQIEQNAQFIAQLKEKQAIKEAAQAEKQAKKDAIAKEKADAVEAQRLEAEQRQAYVDSIFEKRGMRK